MIQEGDGGRAEAGYCLEGEELKTKKGWRLHMGEPQPLLSLTGRRRCSTPVAVNWPERLKDYHQEGEWPWKHGGDCVPTLNKGSPYGSGLLHAGTCYLGRRN